jgi:cyclopropane fatty-acyl-phospholipid synthase-like methyltransferase
MRSIDVAGFEAKFADDGDPWSTWTDRDEAVKRVAILHALGAGATGRVLELGAGNGSNSMALAQRALRLDATEATATGTALVAKAIAGRAPRARASKLVVPEAPPRSAYDAIVVAELLYYLDPRTMERLARQVSRLLRPGGRLILAHHRITFYDFAQPADDIQDRFLRATGTEWAKRTARRTGRWAVVACRKSGRSASR